MNENIGQNGDDNGKKQKDEERIDSRQQQST